MDGTALAASQETWMGKRNSTGELIGWTLRQSASRKVVLTTGFGMEGCALIEKYAAAGKRLEVIYLDTGFFFPETYHLIGRLKRRHPHLDFVNRGTRLGPREQASLYGDRLWETNADLCCRLRKVDPMGDALRDVEIWVTGLRKGQSRSRSGVKAIDWNERYRVLKVAPLADWSRRQVWDYVRSSGALYNPLHENGYPSIGCTHCTRPVVGLSLEDYSRAGRWAGTGKTECGLHI